MFQMDICDSLGDHALVHIHAIVEGNEEQLDSPVLTANDKASQDNGFARDATWGSRGHKPGGMIGSEVR